MSTTTVFGQVDTNQASTHTKRNAGIVFTVIALFALSFFLGRTTAPNHVGSSAQTHAQLSQADRAIVANDVAPVTNGTTKLSPADRAIIANDVARVTSLSQANTTSCIAGRPC